MRKASLLLAAVFSLLATRGQADVGSTRVTGIPTTPTREPATEQRSTNTSVYEMGKPSPQPEPPGNQPGIIGQGAEADSSAVPGPGANSYQTQGRPLYLND